MYLSLWLNDKTMYYDLYFFKEMFSQIIDDNISSLISFVAESH